MTNAQKIALRLSQVRQRLNEVAGLEGDAFTAEIRVEADGLHAEYSDLETRARAAALAEGEPETRHVAQDAEHRERVELRSRAHLGAFVAAAMRGRAVTGAEAELQAAAGIEDGIPLELWDVERRADSPTGVPGTTGVNLDSIRPAVFANSIAPRLGIEMPRVESGSYASATITTSLTAGAEDKSGVADSTPALFTVTSATPKRISARLSLTLEDIALVGTANFEAALRENLSLILSDELDKQAINGDGAAPNLAGLFNRLTAPAAAPSAVADFDAFAAAHALGVDGLWANGIGDVSIVAGPATYQLAARTFQSATNYKGEMSAAAYAMGNAGGFWTNKRMPIAATFLNVADVQQAILYRMGRSFLNMGEGYSRTAVCPHWNMVSIDDIYSGSAKAERYFTMHVVLGDVIVVQPDAYKQIAYKVA